MLPVGEEEVKPLQHAIPTSVQNDAQPLYCDWRIITPYTPAVHAEMCTEADVPTSVDSTDRQLQTIPSSLQRKLFRCKAWQKADLVDLFDVGAAGIGAMAQDHLLQKHECALVVHVLPHLQYSGDRRVAKPTLGALLISAVLSNRVCPIKVYSCLGLDRVVAAVRGHMVLCCVTWQASAAHKQMGITR